MELKTEIAEPVRLAHPAIVTAIGLLTQSAQDLADCVSIDGVPGWVDEPEAKLAYDKDIATATALMTVQAEIEAPLLARIEALEGSLRTSVAEAEAYKKYAIRSGLMWMNFVLAMQAAIIEKEIGKGESAALDWIENTLCGPDLYPDIDEAKAMGGAQKWFDAKTAEEDARVAGFNLPPHQDTLRLNMLISSGLQVHESCGKFRLREVMDGHVVGKCHDSARAALDAGLICAAEALPILRLAACDTEGGAHD